MGIEMHKEELLFIAVCKYYCLAFALIHKREREHLYFEVRSEHCAQHTPKHTYMHKGML